MLAFVEMSEAVMRLETECQVRSNALGFRMVLAAWAASMLVMVVELLG